MPRPIKLKHSEPCPFCKKPLHWRWKRKLEGKENHVIGRPKKYDYEVIREMKIKNPSMTIRELSLRNKCSKSAVQRALKT